VHRQHAYVGGGLQPGAALVVVCLAVVTLQPSSTTQTVAGCSLVGCSVVSGRPLRSRAVSGVLLHVCVCLGPVLASHATSLPAGTCVQTRLVCSSLSSVALGSTQPNLFVSGLCIHIPPAPLHPLGHSTNRLLVLVRSPSTGLSTCSSDCIWEEGGGVRSGPGEARTILLLHIISVRPSKQPLMVRTFLKVYMELSSYFLFLQEQIKDIIIIEGKSPLQHTTVQLDLVDLTCGLM
jgi:hypothetical protein